MAVNRSLERVLVLCEICGHVLLDGGCAKDLEIAAVAELDVCKDKQGPGCDR